MTLIEYFQRDLSGSWLLGFVYIEKKKTECEIGRIMRVFCELIEIAAQESPSLRRNSHLGRDSRVLVWVCIVCEQNHRA